MVPKVTEEHKQAIHEQILQAAETLFSSKGYHGTSMNDIVKESGLSKGAIYGHFRSKEQLFQALQERQLAATLDQIKLVFSPDDSAVEKMWTAADAVFNPICDCPKEVCRMSLEFMIEASRMKSLQPGLESRYSKIHSFISELIDEGINKGEFRQDIDADTLASILFAALDGLSLHWATTSKAFDMQKIKETMITSILKGIVVDAHVGD